MPERRAFNRCDEIVVTASRLCKGDFLARLADIAEHRPFGVLLREKDMDPEPYLALSLEAARVCGARGVPLIPHTHPVPGIRSLHLPFALANAGLAQKHALSVSVHSVEEARRAEALGAQFLIAGHIFATGCKPILPPRGLAFLRKLCETVHIPVFAIGGISENNMEACLAAGAAGVCRMSYWMEADLGEP
jgi:thiamine-phosphate pyrophosphorylase